MTSAGLTCGIDWAEAHHDVALVDQDGKVLARKRVTADLPGFTALLELIAEHGGDPEQTPVAIETDKNLFVVALAAAGFTVYPINPKALARYRERHGQSGAKSDPADATTLANVLRTDRHVHRPLPAISDQGLAVKALARQHQEAIWALNQTISRLRAVLLEFYPQAVKAFPKLQHHAATTVLAAAPTPAAGQRLTRRRIEALLRRCGRRNDPALVEQILTDLKAPTLRQPDAVEKALGTTVEGQRRSSPRCVTPWTSSKPRSLSRSTSTNSHLSCDPCPDSGRSWLRACSPRSAMTRPDSQAPPDSGRSPAPHR